MGLVTAARRIAGRWGSFSQLSYYQFYEWQHAALSPWRAAATATKAYFQNPLNPFAATPFGKGFAAGLDVFERSTRRYGKPSFGISETTIGGLKVPVSETIVFEQPFCRVIHFTRALPKQRNDPKVLI